MFKKLTRNIYLPIVLIAVTLIAFIDVFSIAMFTDTLKDAHEDIDRKRIYRVLDSCELYLSSVATSAYNLSLDEELIAELSSPSGKSLVSKLDNTCNYSLKINAVCAYSANGGIYSSSQIADVPTIEELKRVDEIKNFIEGDGAAAISMRTEYIADIYNNTSYPDKMGVITCCRKVYDGDGVVGWIFADVLPSNLYSLLFSNGQFDDAVAFITFNGNFFDYADNSSKSSLLTGGHEGYFSYEATSDDGLFSIALFNGKGEYFSQLTLMIVILLSVSAALVIGVHFAARLTALSVTKRLDKLIDKMNSQKIS